MSLTSRLTLISSSPSDSLEVDFTSQEGALVGLNTFWDYSSIYLTTESMKTLHTWLGMALQDAEVERT